MTERKIHLAARPGKRRRPDDLPRANAVVANKVDAEGADRLDILREMIGEMPILPCHGQGEGMEELRTRLFRLLNVIRIYGKQPGKQADMKAPFTIPKAAAFSTSRRRFTRSG